METEKEEQELKLKMPINEDPKRIKNLREIRGLLVYFIIALVFFFLMGILRQHLNSPKYSRGYSNALEEAGLEIEKAYNLGERKGSAHAEDGEEYDPHRDFNFNRDIVRIEGTYGSPPQISIPERGGWDDGVHEAFTEDAYFREYEKGYHEGYHFFDFTYSYD